jgi:hypothetical protein
MKLRALIPIFALAMFGCASKPPPPPAHAETTSASLPPEAFKPPGEVEMTLDDKGEGEAKKQPPATRGQADTTASKRQSGTLMTLPSNSKPK